jgi:pyruvate/2-oxoglutarate dehydrogenase complex dihydrolipoamide acyltransferase (E2) component
MKKFRDRKDARRLTKKEMTGMAYINCDLKKKRAYREVFMNVPIDVTEMIKYVEKENKKDDVHITYFHMFCMAIGKTIYNNPNLNVFSMGGNFYMRNDVVLSFVAKTDFSDEAKEVMQMLKVKEDDNIFTLSEKISGGVKKARSDTKPSTSGGDNLVDNVGHLPTIIRRPVVGIFKLLDRFDLLPKSLTEEVLYYSSVIMSNIGTLNSPRGIYHDLTDFGTNSIMATMGKIYKQEVINDDGTKEIRDFCDFGITMDEGIGDGYYFIKSVNFMAHLLKNPKLLEGPANEKIEVK